MDKSELRANLADALATDAEPSAETLNMACFWLSTELDEMPFSPAEARQVARTLLRTAGRVLIDGASADADEATWQSTREMVLQWIDELLRPLGHRVMPDI